MIRGRRAGGSALLRWIPLLVPVAFVACSVDLHETVGPRVPVPNINGQVVRRGTPLGGRKVKLEPTNVDSTFDTDRTDADGRYAFLLADSGAWTIRYDGVDASEWNRVTWDFHLPSADSSVAVPMIDAASGCSLDSPADSGTVAVPSLFAPLEFHWSYPEDAAALQAQLRLYAEDGSPVYFSNRTSAGTVRWNGLKNQGSGAGRPVTPGVYKWRMVLEDPVFQYTTEYRGVTFVTP